MHWCMYVYGTDECQYFDNELAAHRLASWINESAMKSPAGDENAEPTVAIVYPVDAQGHRLEVDPEYYTQGAPFLAVDPDASRY